MQQIGNYDIIQKIAEGGMGTVFKAKHRESGLVVAIKVIPSATARNPVLLQRFQQEFHAARLLDHPNIVKAIEYSSGPPSPFLVMEFVDGVSLGRKISDSGRIPEDQAIRLLAQVCQGLHRAHKQNLIHRDVKPDNIMVTNDGVAKLTDLGLVKDVDGELNLTKTGRGLGTPHFMAPEQFRNAKNADIRCDIYSLGATLYMMVTGEVPFGNKVGPLDCWMKKIRNDFVPPKELNPNISERIDWAIRRAMSGDASMRPASCREFIEDLTGQSIRSVPKKVAESTPQADLWYLVYRDENNETHTVKGTLDGIRRALKDGLLGDAENIRASQSKQGQFVSLREFPQFRDLILDPTAAMAPPPNPSASLPVPPSRSPQSGRYPTPAVATPGDSDPDQIDLGSRSARPSKANVATQHSSATRPMIPMKRKQDTAKTDWKVWVIVAGIAVATIVTLVLLLPKLKI